MKKKSFFWWAVLAVVVLVGGGWWLYARAAKRSAVTYETATTTKQTLTVAISGSGNATVPNQATVNPGISGQVTDLSVHLGDTVKKGQLLFKVINAQLDSSLTKTYVSYLQSQQGVTNANNALSNDQTTLANDQTVLSDDQTTLNNLQATANPSQQQIDTDQQKVAADQQKITLDQQKITSDQTNITIAQQNLAASANDYQNAKTSADQRTVTAPIDGVVTTLNVSNGDQLGNNGTVSGSGANSSASPIVIDDLGSIEASVNINEADAPSVKQGQKANLTFSAIPRLILTGTVQSIQTIGTSSQGVVTYPAIISFDSLDPRVKPQMSVSASITTAVDQNVLTVPSIAVHADSQGNDYVQLMVNGSPKNQSVTVGDSNDTDTVIKSGLSEGQVVVTQTLSASQASNSSTNNNSGRGALGGLGALSGGGGGRFVFSSGGGPGQAKQIGG